MTKKQRISSDQASHGEASNAAQVALENASHNEPEPPAYSGPSSPSGPAYGTVATLSSLPHHLQIPGLSNIDLSKYRIPESSTSADQTVRTTYLAAYSNTPRSLLAFLNEQLALPPRPEIRICGSPIPGGSAAVVDFDFRLNMMRYLLPSERAQASSPHANSASQGIGAGAPGWNYVRLVSDGEVAARGGTKPSLKPTSPNLAGWVARFCADAASIKSFTLQREVANWNTEFLEGQIRSVVAATGYTGHVRVEIVLAHARVVVHSPLKVNKFWTSIVSNFVERKEYAVVKAVWPYATVATGVDGRVCAVQSEEAWWRDWKEAIRMAVLTRKTGWLSQDDLLELAMGDGVQSPAEGVAANSRRIPGTYTA